MLKRFKNLYWLTSAFVGDLLELLRTYEETCMDYDFSEGQQPNYSRNLFDRHAICFFCRNVQGHCESYGIAKAVRIPHFNGINF